MDNAEGTVIHVHYTGRIQDGEVFDSSEGREPLAFTVGAQQVIPGFENAAKDLEIGGKTQVVIPPEEGYGARQEEMVHTVPREQIADAEAGHMVKVETPDGNTFAATITEVSDEEVTLDFNHFLAGQTLVFDIERVEA